MTSTHRLTRRGMLVAGGAAVLGAASGCARPDAPLTAGASPPVQPAAGQPAAGQPAHTLPFFGAHQAGIATPPALHQCFIGLDLRDRSPDAVRALLTLVTDDAARLTQGQPALGDGEPGLAAQPAMLTVTVGLGRRCFTAVEVAPPEQLRDLPAFSTDRFEDPWGQTDVLLQVGSNDALTLAHANRMLTKDLSSLATVQWIQDGFISSTPANAGGQAGRNLLGQVDGTVNPHPGSTDFDEVVWIEGGPSWVDGGTVLVLRRIRLLIDAWDALDVNAQELVIGRHRDTGAPLGMAHETDPMPWDAVDDLGLPVIPMDAHARVAHARDNASAILRRPYNYDAGMRDGKADIGLLFAAYMRDPATSFIPMQRRIAESDAFNTWNSTIGSATYFVPAGAREGGFIGEGLFT